MLGFGHIPTTPQLKYTRKASIAPNRLLSNWINNANNINNTVVHMLILHFCRNGELAYENKNPSYWTIATRENIYRACGFGIGILFPTLKFRAITSRPDGAKLLDAQVYDPRSFRYFISISLQKSTEHNARHQHEWDGYCEADS